MRVPLSDGRRRFGEKKKKTQRCASRNASSGGSSRSPFFGNVFASSSFDDDDDSEDEEVLKRERLEAVQFAMQSFDVSDETFNAGVKVAEEEEDREDALKTNVAEFVGAVRGGSSSSSGRGGGGGRRKSKDERGSGARNNKNAAREERQKRQRRPKSSNIANVARETKMSNREVKKSRKVRAVFMGSMDDDDDNNEREEENEDGGSFGGTRFELKEGTSEVLKTSSVSDDKTTNGEKIDVPRIEQRDNNNDKEAVLLTFLNENRMLSEDDDESSRITASNLTKCNDAIRRCTSFEEVLPLVKEMRQFGITPVESTYVAVMIACRNAGTPERAIEVYDACRTSGIEVSKRTMLLTMECAVKAKKLQPAMRVKEDIEEQGWTLSPKVFDQLLKLTIDVDMPGEDRKGRSPKARLVRACVLF